MRCGLNGHLDPLEEVSEMLGEFCGVVSVVYFGLKKNKGSKCCVSKGPFLYQIKSFKIVFLSGIKQNAYQFSPSSAYVILTC